nr:unnamed protein product [Callosobruchus chinensis]
MYIKHRN